MSGNRSGESTASLRQQLKAERDASAALRAKNVELQEKLDALRRAKSSTTRVVRGSTVHVNIPRISKAEENAAAVPTCTHEPLIAVLRARVAELELSVGDLTVEVSRLTERSAGLERTIEGHQAENEELKSALTTVQEEKARVDMHASHLKSSLESEYTKIEQLYQAQKVLQADLEISENERVKLAAEITLAYRECARQRDMIEAGGALAEMARENQQTMSEALKVRDANELLLRAQLEELRTKLSDIKLQRFSDNSENGAK
eukprot:m.290048 g.290048  ORF g.290048 m.290048 type:complete len:262 (-) comp16227_c5_seq1:2011-2796(-)